MMVAGTKATEVTKVVRFWIQFEGRSKVFADGLDDCKVWVLGSWSWHSLRRERSGMADLGG